MCSLLDFEETYWVLVVYGHLIFSLQWFRALLVERTLPLSADIITSVRSFKLSFWILNLSSYHISLLFNLSWKHCKKQRNDTLQIIWMQMVHYPTKDTVHILHLIVINGQISIDFWGQGLLINWIQFLAMLIHLFTLRKTFDPALGLEAESRN